MKAKIKDKKEVAESTLKVVFDLMGQKIDFKAGQYIFISIPNSPYPDDKGNRRHFTISSPPEEKDIAITTRIRPSGFKKWLSEAPIGSEIDLGMVTGEFILPKSFDKHLIFLAGGIGVTPFMSMLGHIKNQQLPFKVALIYSNRNRQSTAYFKELNSWTGQIPDFKVIMTMTEDPDWPGEKRKIDAGFIKDYLPDPNLQTYYISGPPAFAEGMKKVLEEVEVSGSDIKLERFTGY